MFLKFHGGDIFIGYSPTSASRFGHPLAMKVLPLAFTGLFVFLVGCTRFQELVGRPQAAPPRGGNPRRD